MNATSKANKITTNQWNDWSFVKLIMVLHIQVLCSIALKGHMTHKAIIGDAWYCLFGSRTDVGLQHWHTTHTTSFVMWFEFCILINNQVITLHTIQPSSKTCILTLIKFHSNVYHGELGGSIIFWLKNKLEGSNDVHQWGHIYA